MPVSPLSADQLYRSFDPAELAFETTSEIGEEVAIPGQERALEAVRFGTRIDQPGYNLFLLGPPGTGKHSTVIELLTGKATAEAPPQDWAYVHNFSTPHRPRALGLPAGRGAALREAMQHLIEDIRTAIPAIFESEDYQNRREAVDEEFRQRQEKGFEELRAKAETKGIAMVRTPMGFGLAPVKDGQVLRPEAFEKLPREERQRIQADSEALQTELEALIKRIPRWEKERRDRIRALNKEMTAFAVGHPIDELCDAFSDLPQVVEHLEAVREDLVQNVHGIMGAEKARAQGGHSEGAGEIASSQLTGFSRYEINLAVGADDGDGCPVVYEDHPTLSNLVGRVEHVSQMGALVTDFSLIKAGALHRANGGYLILDARKLLTQPFSWEALKRNLKAGCITIESPGQALGMISTVSLEPEPIPLKLKVVLTGERLLYYLLDFHDPDFAGMFKVAADFEESMPRADGENEAYVRLLAAMIRREKLRPFDRGAIARIIEQSSRIAGDAEKLSIRLQLLADLLREADYFAGEEGVETAAAKHVQHAIDARIRRADRIRERSHEAITRNILLIDTEGRKSGQINGLSVYQIGDFAFGKPTRITARVRMGAGKVVDIEREVELGGPIHSKGVMILAAFLGAQFSDDTPLSLAASLVFEQSYGGIDGDSASSAELYVLLSALARQPLRQDLAVTGSVNQHGEVQAIGGVNEKIEGFFDICAARGLTGEQGVLIPAANLKHLMLEDRVVAACREGRFHIYPVTRVEDGIELLTGLPAGARNEDDRFPADSLFGRVEARLQAFARARRAFARSGDAAGADDGQPPEVST